MPPSVDPRLQARFQHLIEGHLAPVSRIAAGLRALPSDRQAFAYTQAAWRFYGNPATTLDRLVEPLIALARTGVAACRHYALVGLDWSQLHYTHHPSKSDRIPLSQSHDLGYELLTALVLDDRTGRPLAPVCQALRAADGVHTTRAHRVVPSASQLDELAPVMAYVERLGLGRPPVFILDSEADSVAHDRAWHRQGYRFLVRADAQRVVRHEGRERPLPELLALLRRRKAFRKGRQVVYEGRKVRQWVAEAAVTLERPARPNRGGRRASVRGPASDLRLVLSELRDPAGKVLARWYLLTNLPAAVPAAQVASGYAWRWGVESDFKLMKAAGPPLEQWPQESAEAIAKRVVIASLAAVLVWQLARSRAPEAATWRALLVRLSGRQMHWGKAFTESALLAGLWVLLAMLELMEHHDPEGLRRLAQFIRPTSQRLDSS